ncbi:hypothetical protein BD289DRAFT_74650 [Coniella lustricola]|uniref:Secreted protein n=1 Tax=Coniella lustricola TaxID=2025994 RepID=A0A2T3AHN1_9PEZI|nr:hypothetical protein BD289DRAFT_74650 [Coniella lustricola]
MIPWLALPPLGVFLAASSSDRSTITPSDFSPHPPCQVVIPIFPVQQCQGYKAHPLSKIINVRPVPCMVQVPSVGYSSPSTRVLRDQERAAPTAVSRTAAVSSRTDTTLTSGPCGRQDVMNGYWTGSW